MGITSSSNLGSTLPSNITKISDDLYYGFKELNCIDGSRRLEYFYLEKYGTRENKTYWDDYVERYKRINAGYLTEEFLNGFNAFRINLTLECKQTMLWILYTSPFSIDIIENHPMSAGHEMIMGVWVDPIYPITTHLGITRLLEFNHTSDSCKNLALEVHSFCTNVMYHKYPHLKYMVTCPARVMRDIIVNYFTKNNLKGIEVGSQRDRDYVLLYEKYISRLELYDPKDDFSSCGLDKYTYDRFLRISKSNLEAKETAISSIKSQLERRKSQDPKFMPEYSVKSKIDDTDDIYPKYKIDGVVYDERPKWFAHEDFSRVGSGFKIFILDFSDLKTIWDKPSVQVKTGGTNANYLLVIIILLIILFLYFKSHNNKYYNLNLFLKNTY